MTASLNLYCIVSYCIVGVLCNMLFCRSVTCDFEHISVRLRFQFELELESRTLCAYRGACCPLRASAYVLLQTDTMSGSDLPYYHKQGRPVPLQKKGFHRNAGILLFVIVAVFATICLTTLYYIPEISHPDEYNTVYKQFTGGAVRDEEPPLGAKSPETEPATSPSTEPAKVVKDGVQVVKQPGVSEQGKQSTVELTPKKEVEIPATSQKKAELHSKQDRNNVGEDTVKRDKVIEVCGSMC